MRIKLPDSKKENKKLWGVIKQACESDHLSALGLLTSVDISPIDACINQLIDSEDKIYKVPNFCINDPLYKKELKKINMDDNEVIVINIVDK